MNFSKQTLSNNADLPTVVRAFNQEQGQLDGIFSAQSADPLNGAIRLPKVSLKTGTNMIPHSLGKTLTGWWPTRLRAPVTVSDDQDKNPNPAVYLQLVASGDVVVDLLVF